MPEINVSVGGLMKKTKEEEIKTSDVGEEIEYSDEAAEEAVEFVPAQQLVGSDSFESTEEIAVTDVGTYGDHLVEGISVESNVKKAVKYVKIPEKVAKYIFAVLYIIVGALCVAIPERIEYSLPYIVGGGLAAISLFNFIFAIITKEYRSAESNKTASSVIFIGLSVMIIIEHEWAHTFIPIVWGVIGLFEGGHAFNLAIARICKGLRPSYYIVKGIIELVVAFLLLYRPEQYGELHIIVFGVSLIIDGVTTAPFINKFLTR